MYAACANEFIGRATLNEIFSHAPNNANREEYIEVKILDSSLESDEYDSWTVKICNTSECETLDLDDGNSSNLPWIYFDKDDFDIDLIDFDDGFDLSLLDSNDNYIDYIEVGHSEQDFSDVCSYDDLAYVYPIPSTDNGSKLLERSEDGTGPWVLFSSNNGESPGDGNTPATDTPFLVVSDETVMQGEVATFSISIENADGDPAYAGWNISVMGATSDGTAVSPTHFSADSSFFNIPAGFSKVDIAISTNYIGDDVTRDFTYEFSALLGARVRDGSGLGTILPLDYCETTFVNGVTSFSYNGQDGLIEFEGSPILENDRNGVLQSKVLDNKDSSTTCVDIADGSPDNQCSASGADTTQLDIGSFIGSSGGSDLTINSAVTLGADATDNFAKLTLEDGADLTFSSNHGTYYIEEMEILSGGTDTDEATINLAPGDYYIGKLFAYKNTTFTSSGVVRIIVDERSEFHGNTRANLYENPSDFLIYSFDDFNLFNQSELHGLVYARNIASLQNNARITGAISSRTARLYDESELYYTCDAIPYNPIMADAEYRFDELTYTEAAGEVIESIGGANGQAIDSQPTAGKVCNAIDLTATGVSDYVVLDESVLTGKNDFTISLWEKTSSTDNHGTLSGANASWSNELLMWFDSDVDFAPHIKDVDPGNISMPSIADDDWHHIVWTREGDNNCLYFDKVFQGCLSGLPTGALSIESLILGQEQDSVGGGFVGSQALEGLVDELVIFDEVISAQQVSEIFDNQEAGLGYDGSARICPTSPPVLNLRFDESSWSGNAGEVIDETGDFNAQAINGTTTEGAEPAIVGNPGTCRYGTFDGNDQYVALPNNFANQQGSFTITGWIKPSNLDEGSRIFADDENNTGGYALSLGDGGSGMLRFYSRSVNPIIVDTTSAVIPVDTWTFVTAVHDATNKTREIYVNAIAQSVTGGSTINTYTGNWGVDNGIATIGGESDSGELANRFTGDIDEVRFYEQALSADEIDTIYQETHPCQSVIDHYEINTNDGQGLTCEPDNISIRACADVACNSLITDVTDVQLSVSDAGGLVYSQAVTISGGEVDVDYVYGEVSVATLSLNDSYSCINGSPSSCDVTFADSGFLFSDIPTQLSGKPSNTGFNSSNLSVQAIRTDDETGACVGAFPDGGDVPIELSYTCDAGTCQDALVFTNNSNNYTLTTSPTEYSLRFSTDSTAYFDIQYPHAAGFILNAEKDLTITDAQGNTDVKNMLGSSNDFVERPFAFKLDFDDDPNDINAYAVDTDGTAFKMAGDTFYMTATAVQWDTGQDTTPVDGIPDDFSAISTNDTAEYFESETLETTDSLVLPSGTGVSAGSLTTLVNNTFASSQVINQYKFSEVGIIQLDVNLSDNDYLGAGDILGQVTNVGRFTPAYFVQTVESHGELSAYHFDFDHDDDLCDVKTWAYSGQTQLDALNEVTATGAISYSAGLSPVITVSPFNLDGGVTANYNHSGFIKLNADGIIITEPTADDITLQVGQAVGGQTVAITSQLVAGNDPIASGDDGDVHYTFNSDDNFVYEHNQNSELDAFPAAIPFLISAVQDTDNINLYNGSDVSIEPTEKVVTQGVDIHFARWTLANSYGPETSNLPVNMFIEHVNSGSFDTFSSESCVKPIIEDKVTTGDIGDSGLDLWDYRLVDSDISDTLLPSHTDASLEDEPFSEGLFQSLIFSAPGITRQGALQLEYQVPPWFQYDWSDDTLYTENPRASLTFGLFRGNDRIIYQREIEIASP